MTTPREPLRRIVVVGGGPVGILSAIALRRATPNCQVVVVGQQPNPASFADWSPTALPFTNKLHDKLGIEERDLVLKAGGSHRLVTRCLGWAESKEDGVWSYGETLDPALKTAFARDWGGGQRNVSSARPVGSIAEALVQGGRFAPPPQDQATPISDVDYALRWNPGAYRNLLVEHAQALQVQYVEGAIEAVEPGEGDIVATIAIAGQGRIEADLFVDCSGPAATLLASHPRFAFVDWSASLPTRRVYISTPASPMLALEDRLTLGGNGWLVEIAGRDGLQSMLGVAAEVPQQVALEMLPGAPSAVVSLEQGRAQQPWLGNVVALGDAAARFEPVGPYHLDLAHRQLELLLEMLPGLDIDPLERAEYNRRSVLMMEGVHEVLAMHFAAPAARPVFGELPLPNSLEQMLDQFTRRGRIPFREEGPLLPQEQFALPVALGFAPGLPPASHGQDQQIEQAARREFEQRASAALQFAPPYDRWLASVLQPSQVPA